MLKQKLLPLLLVLGISLMTGCQILGLGVAATVGAVGLAGYAVYQTGDAVVTGVGKAGKATGSVLFFNGNFTTQCDEDVSTTWKAASRALQRAGFFSIKGSYDALSGDVMATTREGTEIRIKLKSLLPKSTEISIRIGVTGDLKMSETIYGLIRQEFPVAVPPPESMTNSLRKVTL